MDTVVIIGYIAGALTTISFVPQVIRTWKLKETKYRNFWARSHPSVDEGQIPVTRIFYSYTSALAVQNSCTIKNY
jgi:hypothetical protein